MGREHDRPARHPPIKDSPPIRYDALDRCLSTLGDEALNLHASVHMLRIGAGLAGGSWERIEPLVLKPFASRAGSGARVLRPENA
ncbi:hypothetical protein GCM10020220_070530 [Nonomuraea rubra]